jgi:hypothetical protein
MFGVDAAVSQLGFSSKVWCNMKRNIRSDEEEKRD